MKKQHLSLISKTNIAKAKQPKKDAKKITVIGSGAWGLAISELLARNGHLLDVFSRYKDEVVAINQKYHNSKSVITASTSLKNVANSDFIFLVVPSDAVLSVLKSLTKHKITSKTRLIICSKGIDGKNLQLFSHCVEQELPKNDYAVLSGPNFASEVIDLLPTTTTIAAKQKKVAAEIADLLKNNDFLPIISDDIISAQVFGAVKNILAIGCGVVDGLKLGENAKAALVLKGVLETTLLIEKLGGKPFASFISPAGLGDLFLTCGSQKSRNNSLGFMIGSGKKITDIVNSGKTFEGFNASTLVIKFAKKHHITLPICEKITQILHSNFTKKEIRQIISQAILSN
jgi:glycerol-3-phosphate dehydrogenase (NAD(P)+)